MSWLSHAHNANEMGPIGDWHKKVRGVKEGNSRKKGKGSKGSKDSGSSGGESSSSEMSVPQRDILKEGRDALTLMKEAYPQIYSLRGQYDSKFAELDAKTGEARNVAETAGVKRQGKNIRDALLAANPNLAKAENLLGKQLDATGPSAIEQTLTDQALSELKLGGALSADELRSNQQGSRAAWSARGLMHSNPSMIDEVMSRTQMSDQRKAQRQAVAAGVDAQNNQRINADRQFAQNTFASEGAYFDPYQRMYGNGGSAVTGQVNSTGQFQPFLSASQDVGLSNQQANVSMAQANMANQRDRDLAKMEMDAQYQNALLNRDASMGIARRNSKSATNAALIGAGGAVAGATLAATSASWLPLLALL